MPVEKSNTKAALRAEALAGEIGGDQDALCDWDRAPLRADGDVQIGARSYSRRVCSADPEHVKLVEL